MRAQRLWLALVIVLAAGCSGVTAPSASPGSMDDVIANLVLRGVTVQRAVSGDPGCPSSTLHSNAVHLELSVGSQSRLYAVFLFRWRRADQFEAAAQPFADCAAEYDALNPGQQLSMIEVDPWRAYGPLWTDEFKALLIDALRTTAG